MISRVGGTVVGRDTDRVELRATSGVVYEIHVPMTVFRRLPEVGTELELLTAYVVRDETPSLYGFLDENERTLFHRLMKVQKVGPRLAMALLSTYHAHRLARGIAEKDGALLSRVTGVGKKTAERIVLELSDKVSDLAVPGEDAGPEAKRAGEAVAALVALGYTFKEADDAVQKEIAGDGPRGSREEGARPDGTPGDGTRGHDTQSLVRRVLARRGRG